MSSPASGGTPSSKSNEIGADRRSGRVSARACEWRAARRDLVIEQRKLRGSPVLSIGTAFGSLIAVSHESAGLQLPRLTAGRAFTGQGM